MDSDLRGQAGPAGADESALLAGGRAAADTGDVAPASQGESRGTGGAERSELALDPTGAGARRWPPAWTPVEKGRSPLGCEASGTQPERTTMIPIVQRHAVQVLVAAGHTQAQVAPWS